MHEGGYPQGFARKRKERRLGNLEPSWSPQVLHKCCEENRENSHGSVCGLLLVQIFINKSIILGVRGALAPVWGRVSKLVSKKTAFASAESSIWEPFFKTSGHFRGFVFQSFFRLPQIPNFRHFGAKRDPK